MLTKLVKMYQVGISRKRNNIIILIEIVVVFIPVFSDVTNDYSDNMSEQVDMVEVKTEPNESDELFSVCKNTNMVENSLRNDSTTLKNTQYT